MHELPLVKNILDIVLEHAKKNEAKQLLSITLTIGEMNDLEEVWIHRYFEYVSRDTLAKDAVLKIEKSPIILQCHHCEHQFRINLTDLDHLQCSNCQAVKDFEVISGTQYYIKEIEIV